MLPGRKYTPEEIGRILRRRAWLIVTPLFVCTFIALLVARSQPDLFTSVTLVQVLPQRVPDAYVRSTVTSTVEERLKTITEVIRSRTQLEAIITEFNLYEKERAVKPMDDIVDKMHNAIVVDVAPPAPGMRRLPGAPVTAFRVTFTYGDKPNALRVTQRLSDLLIVENSRMRGNLAEATNQFLETQLADARRKLEEQEARLESFRQRYSGRLPSQLQSNMQAAQNDQMQIQALTESIARDRDRKMMLERLYNEQRADAAVATQAPQGGPPSTDPLAMPANASARQRLAVARTALASLELRLKPEHPDVLRAKRLIRDLDAQVAREDKEAQANPTAAPPAAVTPDQLARADSLRRQRAEIESLDRQIQFKEAEERRLRVRIGQYQSKIDAVPGLESEYIALTRDYDTLQEGYKSLKAKSEDSKVAANLERRQIGEQFRVLDPPRVQERPETNSRLRTNMMGAVMGLALGLVLVALLEFLDTSFRTESDVLAALSLPVLAVLPFTPTAADEQRARRRRLLLASATAVVLVASGSVFWYLQLWRFIT